MFIDTEKFRLAMLNSPMPQRELIKRAGVSSTVWRRAKAGKPVLPYIACRIARGLGVDPAELVRDEEPQKGA